jgi:predicted DsbA family dithiol-disulfide isomerase
MDTNAFNSCLQSERYLSEIDKDAKDAASIQLTGTPSFIIGKTSNDVISGQVVIGAQPLNVFEATIIKILNEK